MFDVVRMIGSARILEKSISSIRKCFWTLFYCVLPDKDLTANRCYMRLITFLHVTKLTPFLSFIQVQLIK